MASEYKTEYGLVTISKPSSISRKLITLTLVKPENTSNGWGVSRTLKIDNEINQKLADDFARDASELV